MHAQIRNAIYNIVLGMLICMALVFTIAHQYSSAIVLWVIVITYSSTQIIDWYFLYKKDK